MEGLALAAAIIEEVCRKHGITAREIQARGRTSHLVIAKKEARYRLFNETHLSTYTIGELTGTSRARRDNVASLKS
jgi:chromosomal replication initiation ATPase DnaA